MDNQTNQNDVNQQPLEKQQSPNKGNGLGVAALVVGIIAIIGSWIPLFNVFSVILGFVALGLAIGGLVVSKSNLPKGTSIAGLVLSILTIVIFFGVYQGDSSTDGLISTDSSISKSTDSSSTKLKDSYGIGESVSLNGAVVTITGIEKSPGMKYSSPKEGNEFVIVSVTIQNNSTTELSYAPYDFRMQNSQGNITDHSWSYDHSDTELEYGDLAPGGTVSGTIVFEQPIGDPGLTLKYNGNIFSNKEINFKLN